MRTPICDELGIEYPVFAFSRGRDVAAVSRAGGLGVLGALAQAYGGAAQYFAMTVLRSTPA